MRIFIDKVRNTIVNLDCFLFNHSRLVLLSTIIGIFLRFAALRRIKIMILDSYLEDTKEKHKMIDETDKVGYYVEPRFIEKEKPKLCSSPLPDTFIYYFNDVWITGNSNIIITDKNIALKEERVIFREEKYLQTDGAVFKHCGDMAYIYTNRKQLEIKEGIMLNGNFSWNYYHFIYEFLPRFSLLKRLTDLNEVPLIMDAICSDVPQYRELIQLFNTFNRKVIFVDKRERLLVKHLIYPSFTNRIPPNYRNAAEISASDCLFSFQSLEFIRSGILRNSLKKKFPKRLFITRAALNRRTFNEAEIFEICKKCGFEMVATENYSIAEQANMFSNAEVIVGGSGAALSNVLFCKAGCKVICLTGYPLQLSIFSTIAEFSKIDFRYLTDDLKVVTNKINIHEGFTINTDRFKNFLCNFIGKEKGIN